MRVDRLKEMRSEIGASGLQATALAVMITMMILDAFLGGTGDDATSVAFVVWVVSVDAMMVRHIRRAVALAYEVAQIEAGTEHIQSHLLYHNRGR